MTTGNTVPGRLSPVGDPGTPQARPEFQAPAPPSWPWRRGALILAGAAQLHTGLFFLPALVVLAVGTVRLWQEQT
jgi:hypothetical protein